MPRHLYVRKEKLVAVLTATIFAVIMLFGWANSNAQTLPANTYELGGGWTAQMYNVNDGIKTVKTLNIRPEGNDFFIRVVIDAETSDSLEVYRTDSLGGSWVRAISFKQYLSNDTNYGIGFPYKESSPVVTGSSDEFISAYSYVSVSDAGNLIIVKIGQMTLELTKYSQMCWVGHEKVLDWPRLDYAH